MLPSSFPLDIVQSIIDILASSRNGFKYPRSPQLSTTLEACSLVCRAWRPLAQRHLLRKLVLYEPTKVVTPPAPPKPKRKKSTSKKRRKKKASDPPSEPAPHPPPPPPPPPPPTPLYYLLNTMEGNDGWVFHVRTLKINGMWVISEPQFSRVLDIFSRYQRLKKLIWDMGCEEECDCSHESSYSLRHSVRNLICIPQLVSIRLTLPCGQFVAGSFCSLPQDDRLSIEHQSDSYASSSANVAKAINVESATKAIKLITCNTVRIYDLDPPEFELHLGDLRTFMAINFEEQLSSRFKSPIPFIEDALGTLETLTWVFGPTDPMDWTLESTREKIADVPLERLTGLRVLNIEAWMAAFCVDEDDDDPRSVNHYYLISTIVERCLVPNTLEAINITIEDNPLAHSDDLQINQLFAAEAVNVDEDLALILGSALAKGQLKSVKIRVIVCGREGELEERRDDILYDYVTSSTPSSTGGTSDEWDEEAEAQVNPEFATEMENWLEENSDMSEDDFLEEWCRNRGDTSDTGEDNYLSWKHLNRHVAALFPRIQEVEGVDFEVIDEEEYTSYYSIYGPTL